jgi:hypothetical protein
MKKVSVLFLSLLLSTSIMAGDSSSGCGLGWQVFKKNSLISSALRATTNAIFLNSVAMTFGTSGCAQHSIVRNDKKSLHFMDANKHHLMTEMAMGEGEHLKAFSQILGCETGEFAKTMKGNYQEVFRSDDLNARQLINLVKVQMIQQPNLRKGCGLI